MFVNVCGLAQLRDHNLVAAWRQVWSSASAAEMAKQCISSLRRVMSPPSGRGSPNGGTRSMRPAARGRKMRVSEPLRPRPIVPQHQAGRQPALVEPATQLLRRLAASFAARSVYTSKLPTLLQRPSWQGRANHAFAGPADVTSSVITLKPASVHRPNEVTIATSVASRPRAIRMRPMRGLLWRASNVYQPPPR
jgi:hypothetical protein